MAPEVFFSVCYGEKEPAKAIRDLHTFTPAILEDYSRHRVKEADYPAIVADKGHRVRGIYVTGLTAANITKLDYFEGAEYERIRVNVQLLERKDDAEVQGDVKEASAYLFLVPQALVKQEWDFEEFRRDKMRMWTRGDWAFGTCIADMYRQGH